MFLEQLRDHFVLLAQSRFELRHAKRVRTANGSGFAPIAFERLRPVFEELCQPAVELRWLYPSVLTNVRYGLLVDEVTTQKRDLFRTREMCAGSAGTGHSAQLAKPLMSWLMLNDLPAGVPVGPSPVWPSCR